MFNSCKGDFFSLFSKSNRIDRKKFFFQKDQSFLTFHSWFTLSFCISNFFLAGRRRRKNFFSPLYDRRKKKKTTLNRSTLRPCAPFISRSTLIHIRHTRYYVDDNGPRINIHAGDAHKCYRCILHIAYAILCSLCLPACLARAPTFRDEATIRIRYSRLFSCLRFR